MHVAPSRISIPLVALTTAVAVLLHCAPHRQGKRPATILDGPQAKVAKRAKDGTIPSMP